MKIWSEIIALMLVLLFCSAAFAGNENYEKGMRSYHKKDYKNAVVYLKKYVSERPDPKAYYMLGYASYELKRFDDAKRYFSEAYLIAPDTAPMKMRSVKSAN